MTLDTEHSSLQYIINHIFLPVRLPTRDDHDVSKDFAICNFVFGRIEAFRKFLSPFHSAQWAPVLKMIGCLRDLQVTDALDDRQVLRLMTRAEPGDILIFPIRAQNACIIFRKLPGTTIYESFEVDPPNAEVMGTVGRLVCTFPGPAISVTDEITSNASFQAELASFLAKMDVDILDSAPLISKAGSKVQEVRDTADPRYITQLLTAILRGLPGSTPADVSRIDKRIRNDILWDSAYKPWRRSALWLILRVSLQITLQRTGMSSQKNGYKAFMAFLMAGVLLYNNCDSISTDTLYCMQTKIARRLGKLSAVAPGFVMSEITAAIEKTKMILDNRWSELQIKQARSPSWVPHDLNISLDTKISLLTSKDYIIQRLRHNIVSTTPHQFKPLEAPRLILTLKDPHTFTPERLSTALLSEPYVALIDIEEFVQNHLDAWVDNHHSDPFACPTLAGCIKSYADVAKIKYADNPEDESLMLLTVFQMWAALDRLAIARIPLLDKYSPEIPESMLEPLLLRKSLSIENFISTQKYLRGRHERALNGSVFDEITSTSFSVQYFNISAELQQLKQRIEAEAQVIRNLKLEELRLATARHKLLTDEAQLLEHEHHGNPKKRLTSCRKCSLTKEAKKMKISIHEWPLPENDTLAKSVVFELWCPPTFQIWRDTTYEILYELCRPGLPPSSHVSPKPQVTLRTAGTKSRITYASSTKPFANSHYASVKVASAQSTAICVKNGLSVRLFDDELKRWTSDSFSDCGLEKLCTFKLPLNSPYCMLQYAVNTTNSAPNLPIAQQSEAPPQFSLHEYTAFGTLRSGPRLQWLNILRELRARTLSFSRREVQLLLIQAAMQMGPLTASGDLEWHLILTYPKFSAVLLSEIDSLISSIEGNWLHVTTLQTLIILVTRLIASSPPKKVLKQAVAVLKRARATAFKWMCQVSQKLQGTDNITEVQHRICTIAATCRLTYDVDPCYVDRLLTSNEDVTVFIQCSIQLHEHTPPNEVPDDLKQLLAWDRRLSQSLASAVWSRIQVSQKGLDNAIMAIWSAYKCGFPWNQLPRPNDRWITAITSETTTSFSSSVHFNLLNGALLINGKPLSRLPPTIIKHPTYVRLLGQTILEVIPSDLPNMDFSTCSEISASGFYLHFKLCKPGNNLIIQAKREFEIYELIPHDCFRYDFPIRFVEEYTHWLQLSPGSEDTSKVIEFRPLGSRWVISQDNWRLHFSLEGSTMRQGNSLYMLDIRSPTYAMLSSRLQPLETLDRLHITSTGGNNLSIELPRYRLSFFLNPKCELESNNVRGMVIDWNQFSGTMVGLSSQLVLRSRGPYANALPNSRCVIIPYGDIDFEAKGHHTWLKVRLQDQPSVQYFKYDIDTNLGCLVGTTFLSELYKIYLHASTSYPLPDPLTERTGTEEALNILGSARCMSFQRLGAKERDVLYKIADLIPERVWYPDHLKIMQTVTWREIGPLAQHWGLATHVRSILQFDDDLEVFNKGAARSILPSHNPLASNEYLHTRSALQNLYLYRPEYAPFDPATECDRYPVLDRTPSSRSSGPPATVMTVCSDIVALVQKWPCSLLAMKKSFPVTDVWAQLQTWGTLQNDENPFFSLRYNKDFLRPAFSHLWISLYNQCRKGEKIDKQAKLTFTLPSIVYSSQEYLQLLPIIMAFAALPQFTAIEPPPWEVYNLKLGFSPDEATLLKIITKYTLPLNACPPDKLVRNTGESEKKFRERRESYRVATCTPQVKCLAKKLLEQWPRELPSIPYSDRFNHIGLTSEDFKREVNVCFSNWYRNMHFYAHVREIQQVLDACPITTFSIAPSPLASMGVGIQSNDASRVSISTSTYLHHTPSLGQLVLQRDPSHVAIDPPPALEEFSQLKFLLEEFTCSQDVLHCRYGWALESSRKDYNRGRMAGTTSTSIPFSLEELLYYLKSCDHHVTALLVSIKQVLSPTNEVEWAQFLARQWPQVTIKSLLSLLAETSKYHLPKQWKVNILVFSRSLLRLQRAQRLLYHALSRNKEDLLKELDNDQLERHTTFAKHAEWTLIQIEGNFLMRPIQTLVAEEMVSPKSNQNTLLQLNMGEGKSSVIVPLIASYLADGEQLVRVVVLKPLANQMFDLLVRRLGGLANRRLFYFPFSRDIKPTHTRAKQLQSLFELCMHERGIWVVQPEHILSFKLMGIDLTISNKENLDHKSADTLLASERWLAQKSRDILDESDEILSVKYQLVYTSGQQVPLEDHPDRWIRIQEVLDCVKRHARRLHSTYPTGLEVEDVIQVAFPQIRILDMAAGEELIASIVTDLLGRERFRLLPEALRQAALHFITCRENDQASVLETHCKPTNLWKCLLLFRGLLGCGILRFVLQEKRWRVDYGLAPARTLLAVPYRAKDVPTLRADFGHPDVAVVLTYLSYYYSGLTDAELDACFQLLLKLDNPALEYQMWVNDHDAVPTSLREIIGVNLDDLDQRNHQLIPLFRKNHAVINFYLANVVFPKEAKQFTKKLATSAWDLVGTKSRVTTGFSGTNDNRDLLPTSIEQRDPLDQLSTNARVLDCLLQPENNCYICLRREGQSLTSLDFLGLMVKQAPPVRVLLDVGAQMLDMQSIEIASSWLSLALDIHAVVFFDDYDQLMVMSRDYTMEPLVSSQFSQKLDLCGIYLDDAHTRGTDLNLPRNFRAAVTLGPKLTKDRLVQGCMRMRRLGYGQSVMFFAPLEVDRAIRKLARKDLASPIASLDILRWAMFETCTHIRRYLPHWAQQGVEYRRRNDAWVKYCSDKSAPGALDNLRLSWEESDARSLEDMYGPSSQNYIHPAFDDPELNERLQVLGISSFESSKMDEEQEREVSHEAECERQIERPPKAEPASHQVHDHVRSLVRSGVIPDRSPAFVPLFSPLGHLADHEWSTSLLATRDFANTVKGSPVFATDYQRPVNWLVSVTQLHLLVALSPYETNELLPLISESNAVHLHMYSPRVSQAMKTFEDLKFFCIPQLPPTWIPPSLTDISQLNLWAGQLYLRDYGAYSHLCLVLGLVGNQIYDTQDGGVWWESDGFVKRESRRGDMVELCKLNSSPLPFLKKIVGLRRKGMNYSLTHIGKILNGGLLTQDDF